MKKALMILLMTFQCPRLPPESPIHKDPGEDTCFYVRDGKAERFKCPTD